jgi:sulfur transfer protein SufE
LEVVEEAIQSGMTRNDFEETLNKVATKRKIIEEKKARAQAESEKRQTEQNKFVNRFLRLCPYIGIKSYERELSKASASASLEELMTALKLLTEGKKPTLNPVQKSTAQSWLVSQIQQKQAQALRKAEDSATLSRGLFSLRKKR